MDEEKNLEKKLTLEQIHNTLQKDTKKGLDLISYAITKSTLSSYDAANIILNYLLGKQYIESNTLRDGVIALCTPEDVIAVSFENYEREGTERWLSIAGSLLEDYGCRAKDVLQTLARSNKEECEMFVYTIVNNRGISKAEKLEALISLTKNPFRSVRYRILEAALELDQDYRKKIMEQLATDPDMDIRQEASTFLDKN